MTHAIRIHRHGGPEVLRYEPVEVYAPEANELLIQQTAIGVNFIDTYQRTGMYPLDLPAIPGVEACGYIIDTGNDCGNFEEGMRVAYGTAPFGAYTQARTLDHLYAIAVPDSISDEQAVGCLTKGMTAHYLLYRLFNARKGHSILVHSAAGATGQIICQWAKYKDVQVFGTVGSEEKKRVARAVGCDHVFHYRDEDWVSAIRDLTDGFGVNIVYDSIGDETYQRSVDIVGYFGILVLLGQSSGKAATINQADLAKKSIFVTRPSLFHYKMNRMELILSAAEVFEMIKQGHLRIPVQASFSLEEAAKAHQFLQERKTAGGSVILTVKH
jgi:NADPH2:quinone reductase